METALHLGSLFVLGIAGGFLSGLLGIGGGIVMLPLLITLSPVVGLHIALRPAVGITMLQSLTGSLSGIVIHRRYQALHIPLALAVGGSAAVGALGGALFSSQLNERFMALLFALMAFTSLLLLLLPEPERGQAAESSCLNRYSAATLLGGGVAAGSDRGAQ